MQNDFEGIDDKFEGLKQFVTETPLNLSQQEPNCLVKEYLEYYQLPWKGYDYTLGSISWDSYNLATQIFKPKNPIGSVFYIHGYFDHSAHGAHLIKMLLENNYTVITQDLIGHGLSSGNRGEINHFNDYLLSFEAVVKEVINKVSPPYYAIGHSLGGSVLYQYATKHNYFSDFKSLILLAPLISLKDITFARYQYKLLKCFKTSIPRNFRTNSSDKTFLSFVQQDPLQNKFVPLSWLDAYFEWYDNLSLSPPCHQILGVLQGDNDGSIDWEDNQIFLHQKFPNATFKIIQNAEHHLLKESESIRNQVFQAIRQIICT